MGNTKSSHHSMGGGGGGHHGTASGGDRGGHHSSSAAGSHTVTSSNSHAQAPWPDLAAIPKGPLHMGSSHGAFVDEGLHPVSLSALGQPNSRRTPGGLFNSPDDDERNRLPHSQHTSGRGAHALFRGTQDEPEAPIHREPRYGLNDHRVQHPMSSADEVLELLNDHRGPMMGGGNVGGHGLYGGGLVDPHVGSGGVASHFPTPGGGLVAPHYGAGPPAPLPTHSAPMHNYPQSGWTRPLSRGENQPTWSSAADRPDPPGSPRRHNRPAAW